MTGLDPTTDVLVVGGGPAATRAALKAAQDDGPATRDEEHLDLTGLLGSHRRHTGWGRGRTPGALRGVGPPPGPPGSKRTSLPITS
ncbi:hypothetical protein ABZ354_02755 [Streptomyces sp. NPDC005925]|uniref:hypothetical protein n=1 Tax=Streptomyces sp. NPDC005925 TaxID=3157172 RepID=UPI0033D704F0